MARNLEMLKWPTCCDEFGSVASQCRQHNLLNLFLDRGPPLPDAFDGPW